MRYREQGELHLDFHGAACTTISYIRQKYGTKALEEIFRATARGVYRQMREKLRHGDPSELLEHWQYFFSRENAIFSLNCTGADRYELCVEECPAVKHVRKLGMDNPGDCCLQTELLNRMLCEDTPFIIETEKTGECSCRQRLMPRNAGGES